jgi:hypothetical protein
MKGLGAPDHTMMNYYQAENRYIVQIKSDAGFIIAEMKMKCKKKGRDECVCLDEAGQSVCLLGGRETERELGPGGNLFGTDLP